MPPSAARSNHQRARGDAGAARVASSTILFALLACNGGAATGPTGYVCTPECPPGSRCTAEGCALVDGGGGADLAVALPDLVACPAGTPFFVDGGCGGCRVDTDCPAGQTCRLFGAATACVPGCASDARCAGATDGGAPACCSAQCVDTASDPQNCGACGMACTAPNGSALCVAGSCREGACNPGFADCNGMPMDGCETNTRTDTNNCHACGMRCAYANGVAGCADGCYLAGCNFGFGDCNGDPGDGCETGVLADPKNCGGCGNVCGARPHATIECHNAACQLTACDAGWADCNGDPADGCEAQIAVDAKNCGTCGNACGLLEVCTLGACTCKACFIPNAKTRCVNQMCGFWECVPGWADCNFNLKDGCETDTTSDNNNCGACGNVCGKGLACSGGVCLPCVARPANVVSFWPGEGNAKDIAGANDGVESGGITYGAGMVGQGFVFDGTGQITAGGAGLPTGGADRTLELWARIDAVVASESYFAGYGTLGVGDAVYVLGATNTRLSFFSQWGQSVTGDTMTLGQWYHLAAVTQGGTSTIYVNGKAWGSNALPINTPNGTSFLIGKGDANRRVSGAVDEVTMYDRALTAAEVQAIYAAGALGKCH